MSDGVVLERYQGTPAVRAGSFWATASGLPRRAGKQRVGQLTRRSGWRSMGEVIERLRPHVLGWKVYFGLAQTPRVWLSLGEWLRHRLRAIQLKHWRRGSAIYRELRNLGAAEQVRAVWRRARVAGGETAMATSNGC
jgi:hypothetical protein